MQEPPQVATGPRRRPTSADVARRARVSRTTVSFILNGVADQRISEATRDAVLTAARELDYSPNRSARDLATGRTRSLVCIVPATHLGQGALRLAGELTTALSRGGYSLTLYFDAADRGALSTLVRHVQPDAVFPLYGELPAWMDAQVLDGARVLGAAEMEPGAGHLDAGAGLQVEHLAARGHRALGFVGVEDHAMSPTSLLRRTAVEAVCRQLDLPRPVSVTVSTSGDDAAVAVADLVAAGVTGLCCYNDDVALMVLHALHARGLRCPEDVAVVGYDASPMSAWSIPPLTTIAWDARGAARAFADSILARLDAGRPPVAVDEAFGMLDAHVVVRGTT